MDYTNGMANLLGITLESSRLLMLQAYQQRMDGLKETIARCYVQIDAAQIMGNAKLEQDTQDSIPGLVKEYRALEKQHQDLKDVDQPKFIVQHINGTEEE